MSENLLRQGQLIGTFGPGAFVDFPTRSVIVSGLGDWKKRQEDRITETRLLRYLRRRHNAPELLLFAPPPFDPAPDAPKIGIAGIIFPTWFVAHDGGLRDQKERGRRSLLGIEATEKHGLAFRDRDGKKHGLTPIRFVVACRRGHVDDVDWRAYIHRGPTDCQRPLWIEERGTSGEVADTWVGCDCGASRQLYEALDLSSRVLGTCRGRRPWIAGTSSEHCAEQNRLLVRSASNAYFAETVSAISLPGSSEEFAKRVGPVYDYIKSVTTVGDLDLLRRLQDPVRAALDGLGNEDVLAYIRSREDGNGDQAPVKDAEFDMLVSGMAGRDEPDSTYFAETLDRGAWDPHSAPMLSGFERVVLIHRLREVIAQTGFTRFESISTQIDGDLEELDANVVRQDLADPLEWLPAMERRGEGFFIQFSATAIYEWSQRPSVIARGDELGAGFAAWCKDHNTERDFPGAPYVLLHSFAHLLVTAIAADCGYPAASLRERIYALEGGKYGILIHTGSSGSEGTLGGVVEAGRRLAHHVEHVLGRGGFCSNDPVCADHLASDALENRFLHGSACHGCLLIAEPSCEHRNDLLDRALVCDTVASSGAAFFPALQVI